MTTRFPLIHVWSDSKFQHRFRFLRSNVVVSHRSISSHLAQGAIGRKERVRLQSPVCTLVRTLGRHNETLAWPGLGREMARPHDQDREI